MTHLTPLIADPRKSSSLAIRLAAARVCLAAVFLYSGATKLILWPAAVTEFTALGLPAPVVLLPATIALQIGAGLALVLGWHSRTSAFALAGFTIMATLVGHPFWAFEGNEFHRQFTTALEHLAIVGGLLAIARAGTDPASPFDGRYLP